MSPRLAVLLLLALLVACSDDSSTPIDAAAESGPPDAAAPDLPLPDLLQPDALSPPDLPLPDLSQPDVQSPPDLPQPDSPANAAGSDTAVVAAGPNGYGVAWSDWMTGKNSVFFRTLDAQGQPLTSPVLISSGNLAAVAHSLLFNGTEYVLVYAEVGRTLVRISQSGQVLAKKTVGADYHWSQLVQAGSEYGLAWTTTKAVYFARLDSQGNKIGGDLVVHAVSTGTYPEIGRYRSPMLAHGDGVFGITWALQKAGALGGPDQGPLYFARVSATGALLGGPVLVETGVHTFPSIGHSPGHFVITWHKPIGGGMGRVLMSSATGAVIGAVTPMTVDSYCDHAPMVQVAGGALAGVWAANAGKNGVAFTRYDAVTGTPSLGPTVVLSHPQLRRPWLTHLNGTYGLVWDSIPGSTTEVFFQQLSSTGAPQGSPIQVSPY